MALGSGALAGTFCFAGISCTGRRLVAGFCGGGDFFRIFGEIGRKSRDAAGMCRVA